MIHVCGYVDAGLGLKVAFVFGLRASLQGRFCLCLDMVLLGASVCLRASFFFFWGGVLFPLAGVPSRRLVSQHPMHSGRQKRRIVCEDLVFIRIFGAREGSDRTEPAGASGHRGYAYRPRGGHMRDFSAFWRGALAVE